MFICSFAGTNIIFYKQNQNLKSIINKVDKRKTILTERIETKIFLCENACLLTYIEFVNGYGMKIINYRLNRIKVDI